MMAPQSGWMASTLLHSGRKAHAAGVTLRMRDGSANPSGGFQDVTSHNEGLVEHLAEALAIGKPELFQHHVAWLRSAFTGRKLPLEGLTESLECLRAEVSERLPPDASRVALQYVDGAISHLRTSPNAPTTAFVRDNPHAKLSAQYLLACLEGRRDDAIGLLTGAARDGVSVDDLFQHVLIPALVEVGLMWQREEIHIAEEHMVSRATEQAIAILGTRAPRQPRIGRRVLVTSASGDLHDLGPRMVATTFELAGFDVVFLGASTPADDVARAVEDLDVDLVAISAKLDLHVRPTMEVIAAVRARRSVPVLVGGPPFALVPDLWKVVGADGTATTAAEAVEIARRLTA